MKKKAILLFGVLIVSVASFAVVINTSCGYSFEFANDQFDSVQEMVDMAMYLESHLCG
jgi:hypothetical protein